MGKRGDWGWPLVMRLAPRLCGLTLRELGEQTDGTDYAAVSVMLKRFDLRLEQDRKLRRLHDQPLRMSNVEIRHLGSASNAWKAGAVSCGPSEGGDAGAGPGLSAVPRLSRARERRCCRY